MKEHKTRFEFYLQILSQVLYILIMQVAWNLKGMYANVTAVLMLCL